MNALNSSNKSTEVSTKVSVVSNGIDIRLMAPSNFQAIWTKLCAEDLTEMKKEAYEVIDKATKLSAESSSTLVKIPRSVCGFIGRRTASCPVTRCPLLNEEQLIIVSMSRVSYSNLNPLHWELLSSIYRHMIVDAQTAGSDVQRYGNHWERIGFQGTDPATDLRGVGIFGLCQLLFLVSNGLTSHIVLQLLELSNDDIHPCCKRE